MNPETYLVEGERVIAFRPEIGKILESNDAAIMFQQLCHWSKYTKSREGWVYKTSKEMDEETNISERKQRKAREILINIGWVEAEKKMANGSPTWHYRVLAMPFTTVVVSEPTSSTGNMPAPTGKNAGSITKKTHENILVEKFREEIDRLYKGWLIEMVVDSRKYLLEDEVSRASLLEAAAKKTRLTPLREKKLARALDNLDYTLCAKAIRNIGQSPFHKGENDRNWKATLEWLFDKLERIEEFANR